MTLHRWNLKRKPSHLKILQIKSCKLLTRLAETSHKPCVTHSPMGLSLPNRVSFVVFWNHLGKYCKPFIWFNICQPYNNLLSVLISTFKLRLVGSSPVNPKMSELMLCGMQQMTNHKAWKQLPHIRMAIPHRKLPQYSSRWRPAYIWTSVPIQCSQESWPWSVLSCNSVHKRPKACSDIALRNVTEATLKCP